MPILKPCRLLDGREITDLDIKEIVRNTKLPIPVMIQRNYDGIEQCEPIDPIESLEPICVGVVAAMEILDGVLNATIETRTGFTITTKVVSADVYLDRPKRVRQVMLIPESDGCECKFAQIIEEAADEPTISFSSR